MPIVELNDAPKAAAADAAVVRIEPGEALEDLFGSAWPPGRIEVNFPIFRDGRGFTIARRLREEFGFKGEIRAVGSLLPDQAAFLKRSGFDSVEAESEVKANRFRAALTHFSYAYQPAADETPVVAALRREAEPQ